MSKSLMRQRNWQRNFSLKAIFLCGCMLLGASCWAASPDLIVSALWTEPGQPTQGQNYIIKATVKNQGTGTATPGDWYINVRYYVDGVDKGEETDWKGAMSAGESYTFTSQTLTAPSAGSHTIKAVADSQGDVSESNETNNDKSGSFTVVAVPITPVITSASTASGIVNQSFGPYQITATNGPTSYSASGLPSGLIVEPSTGRITGTPTSTGSSTVIISATNSAGTGNATLIITITDIDTVFPPTFNPPSGTYTGTQSITISCATVGATIYYTTDGSAPTTASASGASPIIVPVSATQTIKAFAVKSGMTNSAVARATYTISINQAPTANAQTVIVIENSPTLITLTGTDPEGALLTYKISTNPVHGTLSNFSSSAGTLTYTTNDDGVSCVASDSFTFTVSDGVNTSAAAVISITVQASGQNEEPPPPPTNVIFDDGGWLGRTKITFNYEGVVNGCRLHYDWDSVKKYFKNSRRLTDKEFKNREIKEGWFSTNGVDTTSALTAFNPFGQSHYAYVGGSRAVTTRAMIAEQPARKVLQPSVAVSRFTSSYHESICREALKGLMTPTLIENVIDWTNKVDFDFNFCIDGHFLEPEYHFDSNHTKESVDKILSLKDLACKADGDSVKYFGQACHIIADFYAHTDFVEQSLTRGQGFVMPSYDEMGSGQYISGYFEGLLFKSYSTIPLQDNTWVTIYHNMEADEKLFRPHGYKVGFVPWHDVLNKDDNTTSEGKIVLHGDSMAIGDWAKQYAITHIRAFYQDCIKNNDKLEALLTNEPLTFKELAVGIVNDVSKSINACTKVILKIAAPIISKGKAVIKPITGRLDAKIDKIGNFMTDELKGVAKIKTGTNKVTGTVKMLGNGIFNTIASYVNQSKIIHKNNTANESTSLPAKVVLTGKVDKDGLFTGTAKISVKRTKTTKAQRFTLPWQAQVLAQ